MGLKLHSYETFGTQDGPGIRLVLFTQGCLLRCAYCHNPDTQDINSDKARVFEDEEILGLLEKQKSYFTRGGGLTISGGEPTIYAKDLIGLVKKVKQAGFNVCLDTCGAIATPQVNQLYDECDLVILDVKHIDTQKHKALTRVSNQNTLTNALYREKSTKPMWLRYVLVPGYTDDPQDLTAWAKHFQDYQSVEKVQILPYHTLGVYKYAQLNRRYQLEGVPACSSQIAQSAKDIFTKYLSEVEIVN